MEQELFKNENKRIQSELQERVLQYLFSNHQTYNVQEAFDKKYSIARICINNGDKNVVFIGLNPAQDGDSLADYQKKKKLPQPLHKLTKTNKRKSFLGNNSSWNKAVKHMTDIGKIGKINSIYFLDVCPVGTLTAGELTNVPIEKYLDSIEFIAEYINQYLPTADIVWCTGTKFYKKKAIRALLEKVILPNQNRVSVYGFTKSQPYIPLHIISGTSSKLRRITKPELKALSAL